MTFFRKAYSVACVVLMIQFVAQLYFVAAAILTIFQADDNAEDVYSASRRLTRSPACTELTETS